MEQVATTDATKPARKKRQGLLRRIWKWTWRLSVVLLLALYLSRNVLLGPWALSVAEQKLEAVLGTPVQLEGISGNWWNNIKLDTARTVQPADSGALRAFDARQIEVDYSIWQLWSSGLDGLHQLSCSELDLHVDGTANAPLDEAAPDTAPLTLPQRLPNVAVDQLAVRYTDAASQAQIVNSQISVQDSTIQLKLPQIDFVRGEQTAPQLAIQATAKYDAGKIAISSLVLNQQERVRELWIDLRDYAEQRFAYRADFDLLDGAVKSEGQLRAGVLSAEIESTALQLERLEPWLDLGLRGSVAIDGQLRWPLDHPQQASALLQFTADQNAWRAIELAAIEGQVTLEDGWLRSPQLRVRGDGLTFDAEDIELPLFDWQSQADRHGRFELWVEDVPTWITRLNVEAPDATRELQSLRVHGQVDSKTSQVEVQLAKFELTTSLGTVRAQGRALLPDYQFGPNSQIELQVEADRVALAELMAQASAYTELPEQLAGVDGSTSIRASLSGTAAQPIFQASLDVIDVPLAALSDQLPHGDARAQINLGYSDGVLRLKPCLVDSSFLEANLQGEYPVALNLASIAAGKLPDLAGTVTSRLELRSDLPELVRGPTSATIDVTAAISETGAWHHVRGDWQIVADQLDIDTPESDQGNDEASTISLTGLAVTGGGQLNAGQGWPEELTLRAEVDAIRSEQFSDHAVLLVARQQDGVLWLDQFDIAGDLIASHCEGFVPWSPSSQDIFQEGDVQLNGTIAEFDLQAFSEQLASAGVELPTHWTGQAQADWSLTKTWRSPEFEFNLAGRNLRALDVGDAAAGQEDTWIVEAFDADLQVVAEAGVVRLQTCQLQSPQFELTVGGQWTGDTDLVAYSTSRQLPDGDLAVQGNLDIPQLLWLEQLPGIRRIAGRGEVQFEINGPLSAPQVTASWALRQAALRMDDPTLAALERVEFSGDFDGTTLQFGHCQGELGSAPFTATGGVVFEAGEQPMVDVTLSGTDLLLYRREGVKLRSDTELRIHGPLDAIRIGGEVELTDARYTKPVDFILPLLRRGQPPGTGVEGLSLFSLPAPLDQAKFDLAVRPGNGFRIKTNVANGLIRPDVRLTGTGEVPYIVGEIYLDRTILNLPAHRISIEQGVVRFLEENPFVPKLNIRAGFRRYGYDVTILVTGDILEPIVTMTSIPPLESSELLLFATTGQPPQESANAEEALGTVAVYLAQDWLRRFFGDLSTEEEENLFDRIEIEFGRDATNQGTETIEGRFLLQRDNFFEDDALYLVGERDSYSEFNLGLRIRFLFP